MPKSPYRNRRVKGSVQAKKKQLGGLVIDPNVDLVGSRTSRKVVDDDDNTGPWQHMTSAPPRAKKAKRLSDTEQTYIEALVKKYDTDWQKMRRDIKLNCLQLEESTLERMYKLWKEADA